MIERAFDEFFAKYGLVPMPDQSDWWSRRFEHASINATLLVGQFSVLYAGPLSVSRRFELSDPRCFESMGEYLSQLLAEAEAS